MMLDKRTWRATVIAAATPPIVAAICMAVLIIVCSIADSRFPSGSEMSFFPFMTFIVGLIISFPLCFSIGVPIHLALRRLELTSVFWYIGSASLLTFSAAIYGTGYPDLKSTDSFFIFVAAWIAFGGPVSAVTFWWVARPDRPSQYHT